jgi:2'-5' RNA ligase
VPEDNLHLTLAFLGDVGEDVLNDLHDILSSTALPAATVAFGGLGTFGEMERGLVFAEVRMIHGFPRFRRRWRRRRAWRVPICRVGGSDRT